MELAPTPSPSQRWSPDSAWSSPPQYSSPEDTDDGLGLDNVERWELSRERQKFRRYRTRHLPSNSIFARDLQFPVKREQEQRTDPVQRDSIEDETARRSDDSTPSKERLRNPLRIVKEEPEELSDSGELSFERFASALDSWLHGFSSLPDLLQEFEVVCRDLAEAVRDEASERHRVIEDRLMRQKAQMLQSEAASWALLWHLFGKDDEEMDFEHGKSLSTSAQIARDFVKTDGTAQICLRLVQWLEELASKELDLEKKRKGWYAGSYMHRLGLWDQTKQAIRKNVGTQYVRHLDPDAPTREGARIHPEDQKLEEGLLEDVWRLMRAGRIAEAQNLCRTAGQAWRAASFGGCLMGYSPSTESWENAGKDRVLEAIELDGGLGRQRRIWKWACYCASEKIATSDGGRYESAVFSAQCSNVKHMLPVCSDWESACWALVRSWLDVQIELELIHRQQIANTTSTSGPESWPHPVLDQQPRDFISLFQKLYSGNLVQDNVRRSCKEQHRLVQMDLVLTDITDLLDLLKSWILPAREDREQTKPHGHPQMIRFAAHLVLVLRSILPEELKEKYSERLELVGDLIINTYAIFLFAQHKEELVGAYASHLAPHLCVDLYVHMMELRQNDSELVKRKIFCSAMEYLPFYAEDEAKGSISVICDRFLEKSREVKPGLSHVKVEEPGEYQRLASLQKGQSVQWMCFTPPAGLPNSEQLRTELLARALNHSNVLFREISLISLWRSTNVPEGARILLGHLAEPLKEDTDALFSLENHQAKENYQEFLEWEEYFAFDACYRNWLMCETFASSEERDKSLSAGKQALDAATALLHRNEALWLAGSDVTFEGEAVEWLEFSVTAGLSKPSNPCLVPDPTICTALTSALYLCMGEVASSERQLKVHVAVNPKNENFLDIGLRCLAAEGEGIGSRVTEDGGFLSAIMATAIKGELPHFQAGVALEVLRMDAWCIGTDGIQEEAAFLVRGLCRRCCLPELVVRCMQIRAWLQALGATVEDNEDDLLGLVASGDGLHSLFSRKQLEEFLVLEREIVIRRMEAVEDETSFQDMSEYSSFLPFLQWSTFFPF